MPPQSKVGSWCGKIDDMMNDHVTGARTYFDKAKGEMLIRVDPKRGQRRSDTGKMKAISIQQDTSNL